MVGQRGLAQKEGCGSAELGKRNWFRAKPGSQALKGSRCLNS